MKALPLALFFALSLYLLPNPTHSTRNPIRLPTAASATPVLDIEGNEVLPGETYFIRSWKWTHGGVRLISLDGATTLCPSDVIIGTGVDNGNPVVFTPAEPNAPVVLQSTFQNIKFDFPMVKLCVNNVSWEVEYDASSGQRFVRAGDVLSHQFKIGFGSSLNGGLNAYTITYCESGTENCYDVGTDYGHKNWPRLALSTDEPWNVWFQKAGDV
nr:sporamin B-like isoform X2 [Ipomoea trifida]